MMSVYVFSPCQVGVPRRGPSKGNRGDGPRRTDSSKPRPGDEDGAPYPGVTLGSPTYLRRTISDLLYFPVPILSVHCVNWTVFP